MNTTPSSTMTSIPTVVLEGLRESLEAFEACAPLRKLSGEEFSGLYLTVKQHELQELMRVISPWEREHLLLNV